MYVKRIMIRDIVLNQDTFLVHDILYTHRFTELAEVYSRQQDRSWQEFSTYNMYIFIT